MFDDDDIGQFYRYIRGLLIGKNNLIEKPNTYNAEETYGIPPDKFLTQYEIEKNIQEKNDAINKKPDPETELKEALIKENLSEEFKAELSKEEFSNQKSVLIDEMYTWFGEVQADGSYPANQTICSKKFEISKGYWII